MLDHWSDSDYIHHSSVLRHDSQHWYYLHGCSALYRTDRHPPISRARPEMCRASFVLCCALQWSSMWPITTAIHRYIRPLRTDVWRAFRFFWNSPSNSHMASVPPVLLHRITPSSQMWVRPSGLYSFIPMHALARSSFALDYSKSNDQAITSPSCQGWYLNSCSRFYPCSKFGHMQSVAYTVQNISIDFHRFPTLQNKYSCTSTSFEVNLATKPTIDVTTLDLSPVRRLFAALVVN
jgi:hypothetical protein